MAKYINSSTLLRRFVFVGFLLTLVMVSKQTLAQFKELKSDRETPVTFTANIFQHEENPLKKYLALTFQNEKKWHTYWKNPGDAGIPLSFEFFSNKERVNLKPLEWPYPQRFIEKGDMLAYGYEGRYTFFFPLADKDIKTLKGKSLTIKSKWLVCKEICIPGQDTFKGRFDNDLNLTKNFEKVSVSPKEINKAFINLPKKVPFPKNLVLNLHKKENANELYLSYHFQKESGKTSLFDAPKNNNILTPFPQSPFDFHKEEIINKGQGTQIKMKVQWDGEYMDPPIDFPKNGSFKKPYRLSFLYHDGKGSVGVIEKSFSGFLLSPEGSQTEKEVALKNSSLEVEKNLKSSPSLNIKSDKVQDLKVAGKPKKEGLLLTFFFALLGGFILNFMPCVFPVISLKLFSLLKQKEMGQLSIMKHNAVYSSGILFSFLVLSFIVLILKSSGEQIGWGFHLQSASFLSIMILFLFILSLNLFGLYEIRTPGGKVIGNIDIDSSYKSDFISGVLATILSTPCSAPFLGVALTFAFTSSFPVTLLIFLSVGLGLSLPFLFVGIFPAMLKVLPKPGTWMEHFKKFLGLSLLLTSLWLFDVFQTIIPTPMSSTILILTLILTFFTFYSLKHMKLNKLGSLMLIIIPFLSLFYLVGIQLDAKDINASSRVVQKATNHPSNWEVWAPEKMSYYKKEGQAVFVDFTAKWCFTCIVNEKLVLQTKEFEKLMQDKGIKPLIADWTKRDPIIGNWLKQQGVFGLPAYFIQTSQGKLIHLGETISIKEIKKHL